MDRAKLVTCLAAAVITLAGATHLAQPAQASTEEFLPCTPTQRAYAQGYADGSCDGGGTVSSCEQTENGGYYFVIDCG